MLTRFDENFCHQTIATFEQVASTDRNWAEKAYIGAFDPTSGLALGFGIGKYPNRNVMDGFGGVSLRGRQHTVRTSRELLPEIDIDAVGPVSYEVVAGLERIRFTLGENEYGVSFDLEFEGRTPPMEEPAGITRVSGTTLNQTSRFYQVGRARGHVTVAGEHFEIDPTSCHAYRDRSWGIRMLNGVPQRGSWYFRDAMGEPESGLAPIPSLPGFLGALLCLEFEECAIFYTYAEGPDGNPMPSGVAGNRGFLLPTRGDPTPPVEIVGADLAFEFTAGSPSPRSIEARFSLADGSDREIHVEALGPVFYPRAGGYYGFRGWWQGKWMGTLVVEGEILDLADAQVLDEITTGQDIACSCRCDAESGHGFVAPAVAGSLPKYGLVPQPG